MAALTQTKQNKSKLLQQVGSLIGLILIVVVISILNPSFLAPSNLFNILRQVSINALIAFGMTFVILTGGIDLSVGSILALSSAIMAGMLASGTDAFLAMGVGLLAGLIMGLINGLIISKGKIAPFIATLATMTVFRGLTLVYMDGRPITGLGDNIAFQMLGRGYMAGIPIPAVTMLIAFGVLYFVFVLCSLACVQATSF